MATRIMGKILFFISLWLTKLLGFVIRTMHLGQASNFPGKLALKIQKNFIKHFKSKSKIKIILITGTNGKSTTCGLLANFLKIAGYKVAYNAAGANLMSGVASTLILHSNITGSLNFDYLIFEIDEATLPLLTKEIKPHLIAVTNLFRDQLDRFGELDTTAKLIEKGLSYTETNVLLNADDFRVAFLNTSNKKSYFGLDIAPASENKKFDIDSTTWQSDPEEVATCPRCNSSFEFKIKFLAHLGDYFCTKCGLKRPERTFSVTDYKSENNLTNFNVSSSLFTNHKNNFFLPMVGTFNLYNALCAISAAKLISDITSVQIQKALQSYVTIFGRGEKIIKNGKDIWIYLIKNPTGTTEVLKTLSSFPNARFLLALNDNYADGRDVSWIWDARFDLLKDHKKEIFVSGKRAFDMALRLKYSGIGSNKIKLKNDLIKSVNEALSTLENGETLYILPTYTALLELQKKGIAKGRINNNC